MGNIQPGGANYHVNYDRNTQQITFGIGAATRVYMTQTRGAPNPTTTFSDQKAQAIMQGMHQMFALYSKNLAEVAKKPPADVQRILDSINFTYSGIGSDEHIVWQHTGKMGPEPFKWKADKENESAAEIAGMLILTHQLLQEPSILANIPQVADITGRPDPQLFAPDPARKQEKEEKLERARSNLSWFKAKIAAFRNGIGKAVSGIPGVGSMVGSLFGPGGIEKLNIREPMEFAHTKCDAKMQRKDPHINGYVQVYPYLLGDKDDLVAGNGALAIECPRVAAALSRSLEAKDHKAEYMRACSRAFDVDGNKLAQPRKPVNVLTIPIDDTVCQSAQDTVKTFIQMYSGYEHIAKTQQGVSLSLDGDQVRQSLPIYLMHKLASTLTGCSETNNLDHTEPYRAAMQELDGLINVGLSATQVVSLIPKIISRHCLPQAGPAQPAANPQAPGPNP